MKAFEFVNDFFTGENYKYEIATVYDIPHGGTSSLFTLMEMLQKQAKQDMVEFMSLIKEKYTKIASNSTTHIMRGIFAQQIQNLSKESEADFIVMGTKGASGVKEVLLGSHAANLVNEAPIPVFTVPIEYKRANINSILLTYDGKSLSDNTVSFVSTLSKQFSFPINLFHVRKQADQPLQNWKEVESRFNDYSLSLYEAYADSFEEGLRSEIADLNSLLVLVRRKKSFWDRLMHGSDTKKVVMHFHLPMLILPEG